MKPVSPKEQTRGSWLVLIERADRRPSETYFSVRQYKSVVRSINQYKLLEVICKCHTNTPLI